MERQLRLEVLIAIYSEYIKEPSKYDKVLRELKKTSDLRAIMNTLRKLDNEGLITGYVCGDQRQFVHKSFRFISLTRDGVKLAESILGIDAKMSEKSRTEKVVDFFRSVGNSTMVNIATSLGTEALKNIQF